MAEAARSLSQKTADAEYAPLIAKYQAEHPKKSYQQAYVATLEGNAALAKRVLNASRDRALAAG